MAKTSKEIFILIEKYVSKDAMSWILKDCLSQNEMEMIASQCRIQSLESKGSSLSPDLMAREISQEYFKNPKARELLAYYLNIAAKAELQEVSSTSIPDVLTKLRESNSPMMATGKVGKYLWALLSDERPEAVSIIPIFILKVLETIRKFTSILQQLQKTESSNLKKPSMPQPRIPSQIESELSSIKKELSQAQDEIEKLRDKNTQLDKRLREIQEQYKISLSETQQLKHDKNTTSQKIKDLEQTIKNIKIENQDIEEFQRKVHQLEREKKMFDHDLEKKEKDIQSFKKFKEESEKLKKDILNLEKQLKVKEILIEERGEEIHRLKELLKRETDAKKVIKKVVKSTTPRVGIFVDVQNIFYAAKEKFEGRLDFQKLLYETLRGRTLIKATAYVVKTPEINQNNFISALESLGYEVKTRSLKIRFDGSAKGDWDLGIAIDTISLSDKLDVVVIVSGDGDFVDLVKMLQTKNIRVEVASFLHNTSGDLLDSVDSHFILDEKILLPS